jgi:Transglutaminase-like superfamily
MSLRATEQPCGRYNVSTAGTDEAGVHPRHFQLFIESYALLFLFEVVMICRNSHALYDIVRLHAPRAASESRQIRANEIVHAMDLACVFYFKKVYCLQRSAATTVLMRRHGWNATMVTGAQILPPEFHAWVQVGDEIVNDKPYMHDIYQVLDRC